MLDADPDSADDTASHDENSTPSDHEHDDTTHTAPATSGHSDADSQAKRNEEDESPG